MVFISNIYVFLSINYSNSKINEALSVGGKLLHPAKIMQNLYLYLIQTYAQGRKDTKFCSNKVAQTLLVSISPKN